MKPNYYRIHKLEYLLGLRDDPPHVAITDAPGAIIEYTPLCIGLKPEPLTPSPKPSTPSSTKS